MERGNSAAASRPSLCTCEDIRAGNVNYVHNYACPLTPKCQHLIMARNPQSGQMEQRPCGSRLEPQYACHGHGCPCLLLCPHCGTSMDRRGIHSMSCPNSPNYSFEDPGNFRDDFLDGIQSLRRYHHEQPNRPDFRNIAQRLLNFMREMPVIPPRNLVLPPSIIDGDFEIKGECSVCLLVCEQSQRVLKPSGCDHCFHADCLTPWIREHSTCPNCRGETQTILRKN
jgi:hypothetical protein